MRYFKGRIPVFFRGDSTLISKSNVLKKTMRRLFLKWVYRYVDKAFFVGTYNKLYFLAAGLKPDQLIFAPHAIDNNRFDRQSRPLPGQPAGIRAGLGITETAVLFLYAGKLDANKNVASLLAAFNTIKYPGAHLLIAGDGSEKDNLHQLAMDHPRIHFLPFQNQQEMPVLYGACDVFVLPSYNETWGLAINEAMACGKAVIASDGCASAIDLVHQGENGYVYKAGDAKTLSGILDDCCRAGKENLYKMGTRSRELIAGWNYDHICSVIENELKQ